MAITRAQQFRQMLEDGGMLVQPSTTNKRPGYAGPAGGASAGGNYGGNSSGGVGANEMSGAGGKGSGDKGGSDYGQFGRAVARAANNPTTSTPSGEPKGRDPMAQFKG